MVKFNSAALIVLLLCSLSHAEEVVQVTENGARGDARPIEIASELHSPQVSVISDGGVTDADLGKVVMLYGAGPSTTDTNHQDYLGKVIGVPDGKHLTLSKPLGITATNVHGILGTDNAPAFQRCVDRAFGSNTVISVPSGNYLMISPDLMNSEYGMKGSGETRAAVVLNKGGITIKGEDPKTTILTDCGAWQLMGKFATRGMLFECRGPIKHPEYPLIFENLTMDGGVEEGRRPYRGFPARKTDGDGWDITHGAVIDLGRQPLHEFKAFRNCLFQHWRGEILKGTSGAMSGFVEVTGCDFHDGNASAFNFDVAHHIDRCSFKHLDMAMEFYEGRMDRPSCFENSSVSDVRADLVIVGALTNHPAPLYTIRNNDLQSSNGFGVFLNPAKNILIESNRFSEQGFCIGNGAGAQGSACSHDIVIRENTATNGGNLFLVQCGYNNRFENILITGNVVNGRGNLGCGWGYCTNVTFSNNIATNGASGIQGERLKGEWFYDDLSNQYPPHSVYNYTNSTNIITYANGAQQTATPTKTNSLFQIDDSQPEKIPAGARMIISYHGSSTNGSSLFLSSTHPAQKPDALLTTNNTVRCIWMNGGWRLGK
jgi:hypothetical protein